MFVGAIAIILCELGSFDRALLLLLLRQFQALFLVGYTLLYIIMSSFASLAPFDSAICCLGNATNRLMLLLAPLLVLHGPYSLRRKVLTSPCWSRCSLRPAGRAMTEAAGVAE